DRTDPSLDLVALQGQVVGGLIGQKGGDLLGDFAEILGADVGPAHLSELVADQRMADLSNGHGIISGRGGQKNRARVMQTACSYQQKGEWPSLFTALSAARAVLRVSRLAEAASGAISRRTFEPSPVRARVGAFARSLGVSARQAKGCLAPRQGIPFTL